MKKIVASIIILTLFLTSCGSGADVVDEVSKTDFFVETTLGSEFSGTSALEKTGQVSSSQDINLSSNANGRVSSIGVKTGDNVFAGQIIARLEDNIGTYGINLQRAANNVESAKINYESNKIILDKQVYDAEVALKKLERNLIALRNDSQQNIIQAKDTLENSQYDGLDSTSALQLQQIDNNIAKAELDYETTLITNQETISGYHATVRKDFNALVIFLDDIIQFGDEILGVSEINDDENDEFEDFLGARDAGQKVVSETLLQELMTLRKSQDFYDIEILLQQDIITESQLEESINYINSGYEKTKVFLNELEQTLNNSLKSQGTFGETEINALVASINAYQSQLQATYGAFISYGSNVKSFLRTYKNTEASILKSIELQKEDRNIQLKTLASGEISAETSYERTLINIEDSIQDGESQVETARNNLENAKKTRDVTLRSLQNTITETQISYSSSAKELGKLTITSPINGTISDVLIDEGQEVFSGTNVFNIVSDKTPEVEISFSSAEKDLVQEGQKVFVVRANEKIEGVIYAISEVADENLNYKATVVFKSGINIIGNLVKVEVPIDTGKMLVPINIITTQGEEIGTVTTLSGSTFTDVRVRLGDIFGEYVEIVSCAKDCEELSIITSDVSNFDENKFVIIEK